MNRRLLKSAFVFGMLAASVARADVPGELCAGRPESEQTRCRQVCATVPVSHDCRFVRQFGPDAHERLHQSAARLDLSPPERARAAGLSAEVVAWVEYRADQYLCGSVPPTAPDAWAKAAMQAVLENRASEAHEPLTRLEAACGADHILSRLVRLKLAQHAAGPEPTAEVARGVAAQAAAISRMAEKVGGPDSTTTLYFQNEQAVWLWKANDHEAARALLRSVLLAQERVLGPTHPDVLETLDQLVGVVERLNRPELQVRLLRQLLSRSQRGFGPEHPRVALVQLALSIQLRKTGHLDEALTLATEAARLLSILRGPEHVDTLYAELHRAFAEFELRRYATARTRLEQVLAITTRTQDPASEVVVFNKYLLSWTLWNADQPEEALALMTEILPLLRVQWGSTHPSVREIEDVLANQPGQQAPAKYTGKDARGA